MNITEQKLMQLLDAIKKITHERNFDISIARHRHNKALSAFSVLKKSDNTPIAFVCPENELDINLLKQMSVKHSAYLHVIMYCIEDDVYKVYDYTADFVFNYIRETLEPVQNCTQEEVITILVRHTFPVKRKIQDIFTLWANKHANHDPELERFFRELALEDADKSLSRKEDKKVYSFPEAYEKELFRLLYLRKASIQQVCRYTSLEACIRILASKKIRMNGLAGMNDKSESRMLSHILYDEGMDEYLSSDFNIQNNINKMFILSCSPIVQKDKLDMWRLYADDGKGVCMIYDVRPTAEIFMMGKVLYVNKNDYNQFNDPHIAMLNELVHQFNDINVTFQFQYMRMWQTFTKSDDYASEKEFRLLYTKQDKEEQDTHPAEKWFLTHKNSILTPYVEFNMFTADTQEDENSFPLKLRSVILGPKCPEVDLNRHQLEDMIAMDPQLRDLNISVGISEITNYR